MKKLVEDLGRFLAESKAKKVRKARTRKRASEADKMMGKQIAAAMRARVSEIQRLLPGTWDIASPLAIDKSALEKFGDALLESELEADYGYPIALSDDMIDPDPEVGFRGRSIKTAEMVAYADFTLSCYAHGNGEGVMCEVSVDNFRPDATDEGVMMDPKPPKDGISLQAEWKRKKNAFDPSKDLWPLIKTVMKELKKQMPEYEELDPDYGKTDTERYFGSEAAFWRWKEG